MPSSEPTPRITHKLLITIPGEEKPQASYHPDESAARRHLRERLKPQALGMPPRLPAGSEWIITAMIEQEVARGKVTS